MGTSTLCGERFLLCPSTKVVHMRLPTFNSSFFKLLVAYFPDFSFPWNEATTSTTNIENNTTPFLMHFPMSSYRMPAFLLWCNKKGPPPPPFLYKYTQMLLVFVRNGGETSILFRGSHQCCLEETYFFGEGGGGEERLRREFLESLLHKHIGKRGVLWFNVPQSVRESV